MNTAAEWHGREGPRLGESGRSGRELAGFFAPIAAALVGQALVRL